MKKLIRSLFLLLWIPSALAQTGDLPPTNPPLRIGVTANFPPMVYKEGTALAGIEVDFAGLLGKELGRPVKFVELAWEDQIPALVDGKTDLIMSSMSITPARSLRVAFSRPYLAVGQMILVRREDANKYLFGRMTSLPEGTVGVLKATTGDFLVQEEFPRSKRKTYRTSQDAAKALLKKKIDLFVSDSPVVLWLAGMNETEGLVATSVMLSQEQLAWAARRGDSQLLESVNAALDKFEKDGRSKAIIQHWIPLYR